MKVSREQVEANRVRILDAAGRLFRERGFAGVGVSDIMKAAGLTHGAFYGHFESKEDLVAQACASPRSALATHGDVLPEFLASYLSAHHRDEPGNGCLYAALTGEVRRQSPAVRDAYTTRIRNSLKHLYTLLGGRTEAERRQKSVAALASLVGALMLSRAVDDPALSDEILEAVRAQLAASEA